MEKRELLRAKVAELRDAVGERAEWLEREIQEELDELEEVGAKGWVRSNPRKAVGLVALVLLVVGGLLALVL